MMREELVFGPIISRRLGSSLGINVLPEKGKLCNFDCIYCECGWNRDGRADTRLPSARELKTALAAKLTECLEEGTPIDSITFSGDGEPTLNPEFPRMVEDVLKLRDLYYPLAKVSVLTNATRLGRKEVFEALRKVDNPILKLDAVTTEDAKKINRPQGRYSVEAVVRNMEKFKGDFVLQTMFLRGPGVDSAAMAERWMDIVRHLRPREVMVYTIDRETPAEGLRKYTAEEMRTLVLPLLEEGFNIQIKG